MEAVDDLNEGRDQVSVPIVAIVVDI